MSVAAVRFVALAVVSLAIAHSARQPVDPLAPGRRTLLHAHNAYPEEGRWRDRVDRALAMLRLSFFIALMVVVDLHPGELRRTLAPRAG